LAIFIITVFIIAILIITILCTSRNKRKKEKKEKEEERSMTTAIVYYSKHHGNTKKLVDAIAQKNEVTLIDVTTQPSADLTAYDRIGFASGIYFSSFAKQLLSFADTALPENKEVFYIYTHGAPKGDFLKAMREIAARKNCREIGVYHCQGFDTFGPFKLVGGIAKEHPTEAEIRAAVTFYQGL
jgi:flavodoxin